MLLLLLDSVSTCSTIESLTLLLYSSLLVCMAVPYTQSLHRWGGAHNNLPDCCWCGVRRCRVPPRSSSSYGCRLEVQELQELVSLTYTNMRISYNYALCSQLLFLPFAIINFNGTCLCRSMTYAEKQNKQTNLKVRKMCVVMHLINSFLMYVYL